MDADSLQIMIADQAKGTAFINQYNKTLWTQMTVTLPYVMKAILSGQTFHAAIDKAGIKKVELNAALLIEMAHAIKTAGEDVATLNKNRGKRSKKAKKDGETGTGFSRPVFVHRNVIEYARKTLQAKNLYNAKLMPSLDPDSASYRIIRQSDLTRILSLCAVYNDLRIDPKRSEMDGTRCPAWMETFAPYIDKAQEIDRANKRANMSVSELKARKNSQMPNTIFNPKFFIHNQHSKVIQRTKKDDVTVIDDIAIIAKLGEEDGKIDVAKRKADVGDNTVILSSDIEDRLGSSIIAAWDKQSAAFLQMRNEMDSQRKAAGDESVDDMDTSSDSEDGGLCVIEPAPASAESPAPKNRQRRKSRGSPNVSKA